jgi:hypothetical protein
MENSKNRISKTSDALLNIYPNELLGTSSVYKLFAQKGEGIGSLRSHCSHHFVVFICNENLLATPIESIALYIFFLFYFIFGFVVLLIQISILSNSTFLWSNLVFHIYQVP